MFLRIFSILMISALSASSSVQDGFYDVENPDGSYSVGHQSNSQGQIANSLYALLTKANGYTSNPGNDENSGDSETSGSEVHPVAETYSGRASGLLAPHLEILELLEIFLKFKGELASHLYAVVNDNYDLIRSVYYTLISKVGSLHRFTLTGITILKKVLEFAVSLLSQWQIVPAPPPSSAWNSYVPPTKSENSDFSPNTFYK